MMIRLEVRGDPEARPSGPSRRRCLRPQSSLFAARSSDLQADSLPEAELVSAAG